MSIFGLIAGFGVILGLIVSLIHNLKKPAKYREGVEISVDVIGLIVMAVLMTALIYFYFINTEAQLIIWK